MKTGCRRLQPPPVLDIKDKLKRGELNGRVYRNYIDGHNQLEYLSGRVRVASERVHVCQ